MKTLILHQPGEFRLTDSEVVEPAKAGEALVRVCRVGVCGTDFHAYAGRQPFFTYPRILGHDLAVEVLETGTDGGDIRPGDRCSVEPYLNCGECTACRAGKTNCCEHLKVLGVHVDGGMREQLRVPIGKLHRSESLTLDQLALVETLGIGAHAVDRARISAGERVLVIGAGPIGLAVTQFALIAGARVLVMDVKAERREFCGRTFAVEGTLQAGRGSVEQVKMACDGDFPTVVFDATGSAESMMGAFRYAAHGGRIVYVGLVLADIKFYDPDFHRKEMTLLATRNSTGTDFRRIISLMEAGEIDTTPWITHRAAAEDVPAEFLGWLDPAKGVLKAVIEF